MMWLARRTPCLRNFAGPLQIICCFLASSAFGADPNDCAHFEFPTLSQHLVLTAYEHTSIELPFRLDLNNCTLDHTFVLVSEPSAKYHIDYCILRLDNSGGCLSFSKERCRCESDGHAVLTKTVDKGDNGFWVWWTRESIVREVKVDFNIVQATSVLTTAITLSTLAEQAASPSPPTQRNNNNKHNDDVDHDKNNDNDQNETTEESQQTTSLRAEKDGDVLNTDDNKTTTTNSSSSSNIDDNPGEDDDDDSDNIDNGDDEIPTAGAPSVMKATHVVAIVAGVNASTIVVVGVIVLVVWVVYFKRGRRRKALPPLPCGLDVTTTLRRRRELEAAAEQYQSPERLSESNRIYEEIPAAPINVNKDTSIYLSPIAAAEDVDRK